MSRPVVRTCLLSAGVVSLAGLVGCHGGWSQWKLGCHKNRCECEAHCDSQALQPVPYQSGTYYDNGTVPYGPNGVPMAPPVLPEPAQSAPGPLPAPVLPGPKPMGSASNRWSASPTPRVVYQPATPGGPSFGAQEPVEAQRKLLPGNIRQPALFERIGAGMKRLIPVGGRSTDQPFAEEGPTTYVMPQPGTEWQPQVRVEPGPASQQVSYESHRTPQPAPARLVRPVVIEGIEVWETTAPQAPSPGFPRTTSTAPGTGLTY
jgi:hypothetical protein